MTKCLTLGGLFSALLVLNTTVAFSDNRSAEMRGSPVVRTQPLAHQQSLQPLGWKLGYQRTVNLIPLSSDVIEALERQASAAPYAKGRFQIGIARALDQPVVVSRETVPASDWKVAANNWRVWSVALTSTGALGLRVHFESLALPQGARLVVYDPANPSSRTASLTSESLSSSKDAWAAPVFSDQVVVECQVPPGSDPTEVTFVTAEVSHLYRLPNRQTILKAAAGSCEKDVSCYPERISDAHAVALIDFIDSGTEYLCTGCLLNANRATGVNYFLTANHCIGNQTVANTIDYFWFYQTSSCNGAPPDINSVPMTSGGADLLANSSTSDFSFMNLRQSPPNGVSFLNWTTTPPAAGETLTVIHHPSGDYTRLSQGTLNGSDADFWYVQWFLGVTEEGSSGSPLLNSNHEVIGQLYGGTSACNNPSGIDQFGRFDVTYISIQQYLSGGVLTIVINGSGKISPNYNGKTLQVGHVYKMTALPSTGSVFGGWSGSITTNSAVLVFTMETNMMLQANFVPNPFGPVKGTYTGLFNDPNGVSPQSAGAFSITVGAKGTFSGSLQMGASRYSMSGTFAGDGSTQTLARRGKNSLNVEMFLDLSNGTDQVTGTVSSNGVWSANLLGNRSVFDGRNNIPTQAGHYTMIIPAAADPTVEPGGDSYATVTIDKSGRIRMSGSLADGTRISQSAVLSKDATWPLYVAVYSNQGFLFSWITFASSPGQDLSGDLTWFKPNLPNAKYYPAGFNYEATATGSVYATPASGSTILGLNTGNVGFVNGNLPAPLSYPIAIAPNNRVTSTGTNKISLTFNLSSGLFSGRAINPNTGKPISFNGVALKSAGIGRGSFLGTNESGQVSLTGP